MDERQVGRKPGKTTKKATPASGEQIRWEEIPQSDRDDEVMRRREAARQRRREERKRALRMQRLLLLGVLALLLIAVILVAVTCSGEMTIQKQTGPAQVPERRRRLL